MREILFRAKPVGDVSKEYVDESGFIVGWYCKAAISRWPLVDCIYPAQLAEDGELRPIEIDPKTLGQYIGFHDKNGKKIFEGDKFLIGYRLGDRVEKELTEIIWCENTFCLHQDGCYPHTILREEAESGEVVGNIYEEAK